MVKKEKVALRWQKQNERESESAGETHKYHRVSSLRAVVLPDYRIRFIVTALVYVPMSAT